MKINNKYILILLSILFVNTLFANINIEKTDSTKIVNNFSLSTNLGAVFISSRDGKIINNDVIKFGGAIGFYPSININILLRFCDRLKINTGISFQKYKINDFMVNRESLGEDSLKYDNLQYKYFNQEFYITSITIPIRRYHKWSFNNKKSGMILEYGISLIIPINVSTTYSYQKINNIEKTTSFKNKKQLAVGFINAQFGLFHKISDKIDCYFLYSICATTSIVKDDDISLGINTFEFGIKYNL